MVLRFVLSRKSETHRLEIYHRLVMFEWVFMISYHKQKHVPLMVSVILEMCPYGLYNKKNNVFAHCLTKWRGLITSEGGTSSPSAAF